MLPLLFSTVDDGAADEVGISIEPLLLLPVPPVGVGAEEDVGTYVDPLPFPLPLAPEGAVEILGALVPDPFPSFFR